MFCIAGADSFFGAYIQKELLDSGEKILALNHSKAVFSDNENIINLPFEVSDKNDLHRAETVLRKEKDINIIYLIASHNPDFVRKFPKEAERINCECYGNFLDAISMCDINKLFFASSDTVYGESIDGEVFTEKSPANPINIYGVQKAMAEAITLDRGFSVARFAYMFAPSLTYKPHFFDKLTTDLKNGKEIKMFTDYARSSLTYKTAANCLYRLVKSDSDERIFNICADEPSTKYQLGLYAAEYANADKNLVKKSTMQELGIFNERRASDIILSNSLMKETLGITEKINFNTL
ncbi:MAG: NAD(P)-dependent oxidoreductase [Clostridia bacterium]|nr:NAD(P)-dependent oxidoreductase [Clostridia bacterium]